MSQADPMILNNAAKWSKDEFANLYFNAQKNPQNQDLKQEADNADRSYANALQNAGFSQDDRTKLKKSAEAYAQSRNAIESLIMQNGKGNTLTDAYNDFLQKFHSGSLDEATRKQFEELTAQDAQVQKVYNDALHAGPGIYEEGQKPSVNPALVLSPKAVANAPALPQAQTGYQRAMSERTETSNNPFQGILDFFSGKPKPTSQVGSDFFSIMGDLVGEVQKPDFGSKLIDGTQKTISSIPDAFGKWTGWHDPTKQVLIGGGRNIVSDTSLGTPKTPWQNIQDNVSKTFDDIGAFFGLNPKPTPVVEKLAEQPLEKSVEQPVEQLAAPSVNSLPVYSADRYLKFQSEKSSVPAYKDYQNMQTKSPFVAVIPDLKGTNVGVGDVSNATFDTFIHDTNAKFIRNATDDNTFSGVYSKYLAETKPLVEKAHKEGVQVVSTLVPHNMPSRAEWESFLNNQITNESREKIPDVIIFGNEVASVKDDGSGLYANVPNQWIDDPNGLPAYIADLYKTVHQYNSTHNTDIKVAVPELGWTSPKGEGLREGQYDRFIESLKKNNIDLNDPNLEFNKHGFASYYGWQGNGNEVASIYVLQEELKKHGVKNPQISMDEAWIGADFTPEYIRNVTEYFTNQVGVKRMILYPNDKWNFGTYHPSITPTK